MQSKLPVKAQCIAAGLCCVLALLCLLYKIPLDSDRLYFDDFFRDMFSGGRFADWRLAVAPGFFPDLLFYGFAYKLLPAAGWRLWFVSAGQGFSCAAAVIWIAKEIRPALSESARAFIFVMLALVITASTRSGAWVFLNANNAHVSAWLCTLLAWAAVLRFLRTKSWAMLVLVGVLGALGTLSTALFVLCFPGAALFVLLWHAKTDKINRHATALVMVTIVAGLALAYGIRHLVIFHDAIGTRVPLSIDAARHAWGIFGSNLVALAHQPWQGMVVTILASLCALMVLFAYRAPVEQSPERSKFVLTTRFWLISIFAVVVGSIASGGFGDAYAFRYFGGQLAMMVALAVVHLDMNQARWLRRVGWALIGLAFVMASISYRQLRGDAHDVSVAHMGSVGMGRIGEERVAECVDALVARGVTLQAGVSQYWLARSVEMRTIGHPMLAAFNNLQPFFWMSTAGPFLRPGHYPRFYNFMIVQTGGETAPFDFTPKGLGPHVPIPDRIFDCKENFIQIWYYQGAVLNQAVSSAITKFVGTGVFN